LLAAGHASCAFWTLCQRPQWKRLHPATNSWGASDWKWVNSAVPPGCSQ
jgi:hypothetical protein